MQLMFAGDVYRIDVVANGSFQAQQWMYKHAHKHMEMSHSCTPPFHTHFPSQAAYNHNRFEYTHVHAKNTLTVHTSICSPRSLPCSWAQPSLASPPWLAAGIYCREEREWPSCEANCSLQRERERVTKYFKCWISDKNCLSQLSAFAETFKPYLHIQYVYDGMWLKLYLWLNDSTLSGSNGLGTLLTVTGTGFRRENASIFVGRAKCHVEQITSK